VRAARGQTRQRRFYAVARGTTRRWLHSAWLCVVLIVLGVIGRRSTTDNEQNRTRLRWQCLL